MIGQLIEGRYKVIEKLGEGGMSLVFRAEDIETGQMVALKFLKEEITSRRVEDVLRFQREAGAVAKLEHPGIVKVYGIGEYNQTPYITMELLEGKSLADLFKQERRFSIEEAVQIVLGISEALNYVHSKGIIHRDLKPGNIMLLEQSVAQPSSSKYQVKVLDFGLAQILELKEIKVEEEIVGTFGYMSPEQTGIVHKPVDERSDLYSLGVVFYQLLTDQLPFKGKDVGTLLHQQVAKEPLPPGRIREDLPAVIEEIILKLLRKDAEERYQTAQGLIEDLETFQRGETTFVIGQKDRRKRLNYRTRLIGRERELLHLQELFEQSTKGKGCLSLISGEAGRGKSRLVDELRSYIFKKEGILLEGKCLAQENKLPYQPFKEALCEYINKVQKSPPEQRKIYIKQAKEAVGELGGVILRITPLMKEILGEVPELVELEPERENMRFLTTSSSFFIGIATEERPIVLFIDDLQWADEGTLSLLAEITTEIEKSHLLILGTYRDNEVTPEHTLMKIKKEAKEKGHSLEEINLALFDFDRVNRMVAEVLGDAEEYTKEISSQIFENTRGNPFFVNEIIRHLVDDKALYYGREHWEVDKEKLGKITIAPNILEIVLRRIELLEEDELKVLCCAAVIGREFEINLLFKLTEQDKETIVDIIDRAIWMQLIEEKPGERERLLFVHERIKQAFYEKIGKEEKRAWHLKIAKTLEEVYKDRIEEMIFDLAHHYLEAGEREKSLPYAIKAAHSAKDAFAHEEAERYFKVAIELLEEKNKKGSSDWIASQEGLGEVYLTVGEYDRAVEIFEELISYKETSSEKAVVYRNICAAYFKKADYARCEEYGRAGLALLGDRMPVTKVEVIFSIVVQLFIHILHSLFPKVFTKERVEKVNPEVKEIAWIYLPLGWMYILTDVPKLVHLTIKLLNIVESRLGRSKELRLAIYGYIGFCIATGLFKQAIKSGLKGLEIAQELGDLWGEAQQYQIMGYSYNWKGDYSKGIEYFNKSLEMFRKIGDKWEIGACLDGLGWTYQYTGDFEKGIQYCKERVAIAKKTRDYYGISSGLGHLTQNYLNKGDLANAELAGREGLEVAKEGKQLFIECIIDIHLGELYLEKGEYNEALKSLLHAKKLREENTFLEEYVCYIYPLLAEVYIEQYHEDKKQGKKERKNLNALIKKIKKALWESLLLTRIWRNHWGMTLRVNGKYQALVGHNKKAERYFLKSIKHTRNLGQRYELGKSYYEYGNWLNEMGRQEQAKANWEEAYKLFKEIDSRVYLQRTEKLLGYEAEEAKEGVQEPETAQRRLRVEQELMSLIKVSQYLSSILKLDELLERIMDSAIEVVGAERGFLMLYQGIAEGKRIDEVTKGNLMVMVARNVDKESLTSEAFQASRTVVARVEETRQPSVITDASSDEELKTQVSVVKYNLRSILCVPLITKKEEILGIIYLDNRLISGLFTQRDLDLLKTLAAQAGICIENVMLVENEKEMARKVSEAEARARYADILQKKNRELEIAYQEKDQAYEELKATQAQLVQSEKMATIGRLAGGVAHEINTPLGTILTNTEMLMLEGSTTDSQRKYLELVKESSLRCKVIVEQLLKYSRLPGPEFEMLNIAQVIDESYLLLERQLADDGVRVNREYSVIPKIKANANELRQVFTNIILNARDAIKKTFDDKKRQGEIRIRAYQEGTFLVVEVQDDGCGIPPQDIGKIFDPFFTTKDIGEGTGLGLSVSLRIIERHGGKIEARSKVGQGTTMRVELPLGERETVKREL